MRGRLEAITDPVYGTEPDEVVSLSTGLSGEWLSTVVDAAQIASMRATGASWQRIADQMGIGVGTACRALQQPSKNPAKSAAVSG